MKTKLTYIVLALGLIGGLVVRLKDLDAPLGDWHSFRQADTASVAREYVKHGIDLLRPTYHDLSNIQSGQDNPQGYRMVEFPLINATVAFLYQNLAPAQALELHVFYRLINAILSLLSAAFLFVIIKKISSPEMGLIAALVFLFLPFNIFYSRTVLPEVGLITFTLAGTYAAMKYIDKQRITTFIAATILIAISMLVKPVAAFFYLPLIGYALDKHGVKSLFNWRLILLAVAAIIPLFLWRQWIQQFPEGIPASMWLLNSNNIRFKGAFFYWIFADRLGRLILGYWGAILLGLGLLVNKKSSVVGWWVAGALLYVVVFATGNVQHDYYQIPLVPVISVLIGYGIHWLITNKTFSKLPSIFLLLTSTFFTLSFSWYHVRAYYGVNNPDIAPAGQAVNRLTPAEALVIAPYMGDTAFLYQTNRRGWPIGFDIEDKINKGATHYVSVNFDDETNELMAKYQIIEKTNQYVILDLTRTP
jgi:hypothetical protein